MWQPNAEQASRVTHVVETVERLYSELSSRDLGSPTENFAAKPEYAQERILVFAQLPALPLALGVNAEQGLSEYLCFPALRPKYHVAYRAAELAAANWLIHTRSRVAADLILARLRIILSYPESGQERPEDGNRGLNYENQPDHGFLFPQTRDCLALLAALPAGPAQLDLIEEIFDGQWQVALSRFTNKSSDDISDISNWSAYPLVAWEALAMHLLENERLDETRYCQAMTHVGPMLMNVAVYSRNPFREYELWQCQHEVVEHGLRVGGFIDSWKNIKALPAYEWLPRGKSNYSPHPPEIVETLKTWAFRELQRRFDSKSLTDAPPWPLGILNDCQDIRWPLLALQQLERLQIAPKTLSKKYPDGSLVSFLVRMLTLKGYGYGWDQSEESLLAELSAFRPETLELALPYAGDAKSVFLRALGWQDTLPLYNLLFQCAWNRDWDGDERLAKENEATPPYLDRAALLAALGQMKPDHRKRFFRSMTVKSDYYNENYPSDFPLTPYFMLVEALEGSNRSQIDRVMKSREPYAAIFSYGLLPLTDDAELRTRYLRLRELLDESAAYGEDRRANIRNAVVNAMEFLAETAGYPDGMRLEWAMEARFADEERALEALAAPRQEQEWVLSLTVDGDSPQIAVHLGNGAPLARVPPALRKAKPYVLLTAHLDNLLARIRRLRKKLEVYMAEGEVLQSDQLQLLRRLPYGYSLLRALVLQGEGGELGLLHPSQGVLVDLEGRQVPLGETFRIAHPLDLIEVGQLAAWQHRIVTQQWVQPFKQVFRELYTLTPTEVASGDLSLRFANLKVSGLKASWLLEARKWLSTRLLKQYGLCTKVDRATGLVACLEFEGLHNGYLSGDFLDNPDGCSTTRALYFTQGELPHNGRPANLVPLTEVPPRLLSETFRDADFAVQHSSCYCSRETLEHRITLVQAVLQGLGLQGVHCEGHCAYIQGQRAPYQVDLSSAEIRILPGKQLFKIPDSLAAKLQAPYLPFADTDIVMEGIISRICWLLNDNQIKDKDILRQIQAALSQAGMRYFV